MKGGEIKENINCGCAVTLFRIKKYKMKITFQIIILQFVCLMSYGQDLGIIENSNSRIFEITKASDTIQFVKINSDIEEPKPVIIILQGSLPIPLAIKNNEEISFTSFPYKLSDELLNNYNIVVISMPDIPIVVDKDQIDNRSTYTKTPKSYNKKNHLQTYINRTNSVIEFIVQQPWFNNQEMILFGHSQGSYIAIKVANQNHNVTAIGVSGLSPNGRFQQYLAKIRYEEHIGKLSSIDSQIKIDEYYKRWKHISENRFDDSQERGDTFKATFSFSENFVDDILNLRKPIFIAYGTKDIGTLSCDILPIEFERIGKTDYKLMAYPGLGHNFEEIDENGKANYDKMHWDEVFNEFIKWINK